MLSFRFATLRSEEARGQQHKQKQKQKRKGNRKARQTHVGVDFGGDVGKYRVLAEQIAGGSVC